MSLPVPASFDLAAFSSTPLFMTSLDDAQADGDSSSDIDSTSPSSSSTALAALQSLLYEGTPDEQALTLKSTADEYFKGGRFKEAVGFYSQAFDVHPTGRELKVGLWLNRAAAQLKLGNYGKVLGDMGRVLGVWPTEESELVNGGSWEEHGRKAHQKALFRAGSALVHLGRYDEAIDALRRCDQPDDAGVARMIKQAETELERIRAREERKKRMQEALRLRGITGPATDVKLDEDGHMSFPTRLLYPEHATSDFISAFPESVSFGAQLDVVLASPAEWDIAHTYTPKGVNVYMITRKRRILKVGRSMSLRAALDAADGLELIDGALSFVVLPKGSEVERKWIDDFKKSSTA